MSKKKTQSSDSARTALLNQLDLAGLLDSMTLGVLFVDSARRVLIINRFLEALTGYTREEVVGIYGENVIRSNLISLGDPVGKVLQSETTLTLEGDIINQYRKKIPIRFTISPLKLTTGNKAGVIIILEDISLLKDLDNKIYGFSGQEKIIGHSRKMQEIFELLPITARTDASVLITGETGTGKDLIAEAIHKTSKRSRYPFIKVNCGALPESLLESELFGHVRGAFTGADKDKPGMFRLAHGGTLFLTEIGDLSLPLQVKILTVLDDKEFFPVGGSTKISVDVRIIAATHRDLGELVKQGRFRADLYYRLNVLHLHLPPLREREEDFRLLLDHFFREIRANLNKKIKGFSDDCLKLLSAYSFPGNIRELRNIVEYAVNVCQNEIMRPEHLPRNMLTTTKSPFQSSAIHQEPSRLEKTEAPIDAHLKTAAFATTEPDTWKDIEKGMILNALTKTRGNRSKAAELLGWSRSKLWRKIKHHGLE
ncbi:MAG: sigma 54-interacting transcriptional regulator [Deltaproteobacteria bacterium]|jgi:PAS domain S-box-containing protein|nr:sigma 54-interacting transcriptional regulator [Deltaproteobacteria bacterium]